MDNVRELTGDNEHALYSIKNIGGLNIFLNQNVPGRKALMIDASLYLQQEQRLKNYDIYAGAVTTRSVADLLFEKGVKAIMGDAPNLEVMYAPKS